MTAPDPVPVPAPNPARMAAPDAPPDPAPDTPSDILRIEQAPFYVLARVNMPSILVETAFITHKDEEKKLQDPEWRDKIARAIADGILAYRDKVEEQNDKGPKPQ